MAYLLAHFGRFGCFSTPRVRRLLRSSYTTFGYTSWISLAGFKQDFAALEKAAGDLTGSAESKKHLSRLREVLKDANAYLQKAELEIKGKGKEFSQRVTNVLADLVPHHENLQKAIDLKIGQLQKKGLSGSIQELQSLIKQRDGLSRDIGRIGSQNSQLVEYRDKRKELLKQVESIRKKMSARRTAQVREINENLKVTIQDYQVILHYDKDGVVDDFVQFVLEQMQGTHFREDSAQRLCRAITPVRLAELLRTNKHNEIASLGEIGSDWIPDIVRRLGSLEAIHALETISKPPCPVIKVLTKAKPARSIPVTHLSDGQKHTILLTVAMLAESNMPLVIDQPEDDLDNAFIFGSVVANWFSPSNTDTSEKADNGLGGVPWGGSD